MTDLTLPVLCATAAAIGFGHTIAGPDHYVPFVAMSRIGRWSLPRTLTITSLCGVAHVGSSAIIGLLGLALGWAIHLPDAVESWRGAIAGWLLLAFGLVYTIWGVRRAIVARGTSHFPAHVDDAAMSQPAASDEARAAAMTPWILFTIFVFGPCEPLIPLLMYPGAELGWGSMLLVTAVFAVATIGTMLAIVTCAVLGLSPIRVSGMQRYSHALAGFALLSCGTAMQMGL